MQFGQKSKKVSGFAVFIGVMRPMAGLFSILRLFKNGWKKGRPGKKWSSIEIDFTYRGQRCRETLKGLSATKANLVYATRLRETILFEIALGAFDYAKHFPDSKLSRQFGHREALCARGFATKEAAIAKLDEFAALVASDFGCSVFHVN